MFGRYEKWFADPHKTDGQSMEVVGSPLLAYLTFRTLADWQGDQHPTDRRNQRRSLVLIDITVAHAGEGRDEGLHRRASRRRGALGVCFIRSPA